MKYFSCIILFLLMFTSCSDNPENENLPFDSIWNLKNVGSFAVHQSFEAGECTWDFKKDPGNTVTIESTENIAIYDLSPGIYPIERTDSTLTLFQDTIRHSFAVFVNENQMRFDQGSALDLPYMDFEK